MHWVDEPTAVEARFERDGRLRVTSFTWQRRRVQVISHGRGWLEDDGRHLLVMTAGDKVFELLLRRSDLTWRVRRAAPQVGLA